MSNRASERLLKNRDKIMQIWETRAKVEVAAALQQESLALQDSLPEYLAQIVAALSTTIDRTEIRKKFDLAESTRVGKRHGRERAGIVNYTMDQMIYEYHILRQVIFDVMEEEAPLAGVEREIIICSIEQAVNDAATQFSETLRNIQEYLTRTVAHDLRNPITAVKISAQMLLKKSQDNLLVEKTATRIMGSMDRLDSMIHDLLDASVLDAGQKIHLQLEACDLDQITREIAEELNYTYEDRFLVHSAESAPGHWDKRALSRVIENLATNAVKYGAPHTPITLTVKKATDHVKFMIHNQGRPIPSNEQEILFQQYRRSRSTKEKTGWGLGLTVVKGVIESHRGSVHLESTEKMGTTFSFELPNDSR